MKTTPRPVTVLRSLFVATLGLLGASAALGAAAPSSADDSAAQLLAREGSVRVTSAGAFVAPGTFRVQVAAKLGRPDLTLADGTWLYHHRRIGESAAEGTLVVRFAAGRVSSLSLVTPAVVAALRADPRPATAAAELVATK